MQPPARGTREPGPPRILKSNNPSISFHPTVGRHHFECFTAIRRVASPNAMQSMRTHRSRNEFSCYKSICVRDA